MRTSQRNLHFISPSLRVLQFDILADAMKGDSLGVAS
jgi:hypothetical protein